MQMLIWRHFIKVADKVVANSMYVWKTVAEASDVLRVRAPQIIHNLAPSGMQETTHPHYDPQFRHVIYVGQMSHEKGVFEFIRSAALLATSHPDLRFHLVGGSIYTTETELALVALVNERGIADRVTFHGWMNNAREFLSQAAVHVAPSVWEEPFANVVLEAKREGTPSVVFPSGGLPEMIRHQVDGYICEDKSDQSLAHGIAWVLDREPVEMNELRALVAADYQERFGEERFCKAWADVYQITGV
ncbi:MAG: glycosyltransferase family 4 protein [Luteolibacter sp.]